MLANFVCDFFNQMWILAVMRIDRKDPWGYPLNVMKNKSRVQ